VRLNLAFEGLGAFFCGGSLEKVVVCICFKRLAAGDSGGIKREGADEKLEESGCVCVCARARVCVSVSVCLCVCVCVCVSVSVSVPGKTQARAESGNATLGRGAVVWMHMALSMLGRRGRGPAAKEPAPRRADRPCCRIDRTAAVRHVSLVTACYGVRTFDQPPMVLDR
jgi:hypothetical protein